MGSCLYQEWTWADLESILSRINRFGQIRQWVRFPHQRQYLTRARTLLHASLRLNIRLHLRIPCAQRCQESRGSTVRPAAKARISSVHTRLTVSSFLLNPKGSLWCTILSIRETTKQDTAFAFKPLPGTVFRVRLMATSGTHSRASEPNGKVSKETARCAISSTRGSRAQAPAQMVECMSSMHEALASTPTTA